MSSPTSFPSSAHSLLPCSLFSPSDLAALPFQPFRPGVVQYPLYNVTDGPSARILKYSPGAKVPFHVHRGFENIIVLDGSQEDEFGVVKKGQMRTHYPGSGHSLSSPEGCIILAIYERPVHFFADSPDCSLQHPSPEAVQSAKDAWSRYETCVDFLM
ncbi:hypothetical protein HDU93_010007 [Gonapodya sp. JEL0774]|nr:hypothetical protein HDU93_010007 [Gonapodya sp. JEL0774]